MTDAQEKAYRACIEIVSDILLLALRTLFIWPIWNCVAVPLFNAPEVTYWQTLGAVWAIRMLILPKDKSCAS